MPRPRMRRWVTSVPKATYFKPQGIPLQGRAEVRLSVEGLEALRLADLKRLVAEAPAGPASPDLDRQAAQRQAQAMDSSLEALKARLAALDKQTSQG